MVNGFKHALGEMNNWELRTQALIKRKVSCDLTDCGEHFTFTIDAAQQAQSEPKKRVCQGRCARCHKTVALKQPQLRIFEQIYGKTTVSVRSNTFDSLFVEAQQDPRKVGR